MKFDRILKKNKKLNVLIKTKYIFYSVRSVMHKYLEKKEEVNFDKIFNQVLGKSINIILLLTISLCVKIFIKI